VSGFTKLSSTLTASSIWNEPDDVRIVWVTMLAMADADGVVRASIGGLAHQARKSREATEHALKVLAAPDPDSTRKEREGRRIVAVEGGWQLVNHAFYRQLGMSEETKAYWREKKRQARQASPSPQTPLPEQKHSHTHTHTVSELSRNVSECLGIVSDTFERFWEAYPNKQAKPVALAAWNLLCREIAPEELLAKCLNALSWQTCSKQWTKDAGQFIPAPKTYLEKRRFEDEPTKGSRALTDAEHCGGW
jgi:hypothetical protein